MIKRMSTWFFLLLAVSLPVIGKTSLVQKSEGMTLKVEQLAEGLDIPWGMAFLTATDLLFTELNGGVKLLNTVSGSIKPLTGAPAVFHSGQGGLLDVAVPEGYQENAWIYFTYSKEQNGQGVTTLARSRLEGTRLVEWQDLLITRSATNAGVHFGSRIAFDGEGHLFFTIGDRGHRPNGQDLSTHAGSVLRVKLDGSVPKDNPFVSHKNALPEIWSYGHRNPQGIAYDFATGRLWAIEHGPRGGDEINLILPGRNYGWAVISYGKEYWGPVQVGEGTHKAGMEQPLKVYIPSIAPGSLIYYTGRAFPQWQGNLLAGALVLTHLNRIVLDSSGKAVKEERLLEELEERIRALVSSPEGWLYFSTDSGKIFRIVPG